MFSFQQRRRLYWAVIAVAVAAAYPLLLGFLAEPITVWLGWTLFMGLVLALFTPLQGLSPRQGDGYAFALVAIIPFVLEISLGYGIARVIGTEVDLSIFKHDLPERGFLRIIGALAGTYVAGSIVVNQLSKPRTMAPWKGASLLCCLALVMGLLFLGLNEQIPFKGSFVINDPGSDKVLAEIQNAHPGDKVVVVGVKMPMHATEVTGLSSRTGGTFPLLESIYHHSADWLVFAVPPEVVEQGGLSIHLATYPRLNLPAPIEPRTGDQL